jgi:iron(III) transport system permease protein
MKPAPQLLVIAALLLTVAVVFSPLLAALFGTGLRFEALPAAFSGISGPLSGSVGTSCMSALIAILIGAPFAILVERSHRRLRHVFWALGLLVLMVPPYIVAESSIVLLGPAGKLSRPIAAGLGFGPPSSEVIDVARFTVPGFVYTWPWVGTVMGGCLFPLVALAVGSAYRRTDHRVFESARLAQGVRGVHIIAARILVPPALGAGLLVFAVTLTEFAVPQLLRVQTMGEAVYEKIQVGDLAAAAALSLPLLPMVVGAGALGAFVVVRTRFASLASLEGEVPKYQGRPVGWSSNLLASCMTLVAVVPGLVLPITSLVWLTATAKLRSTPASGKYQVLQAPGFFGSLRGAWELAHDDALRTILLASLAATLATLLAILLARLVARTGWAPVLGLLGAGVAIPASIVGLGLITLWNHSFGSVIYQSEGIVLLAWFARFFPISVFLVQGALARVPRELESAAALAGRGPLERFVTVVVPSAAPGLLAAWLAMYVLSATEFGATLLIAPPGKPLLAPSVVNLMRRGSGPEIAACQFLLLGVIGLPLALIGLGMFLRSGVFLVSKGRP